MKHWKWILIIVALCFVGCTPAEQGFVAGMGVGVNTALDNTNQAMDEMNTFTDEMIKTNAENRIRMEAIKEIVENDPMMALAIIDPNLKAGIDETIVKFKEIGAKAEAFADEKGKVDWADLGENLLLGLLLGGSGVNIYKNRKG